MRSVRWPAMTRLVVLVLMTAVAGCGGSEAAEPGTGRPGGPGRPGAGGPGGAGGGDRVVAVSASPVVKGTISRSVTVSGVIEPIRTVGVNSQLSGVLRVVAAQEGDVVRPGQLLARVDDTELRAQLAAADASFQVAEASYGRAQQLWERRVITLPEFERERTARAAAKAQLEQLQTRVDYARIASPIAGVVTEKRLEAGDLVSPQTRLFTVADVSTLVVRVGVSELDVVDLGPGDLVVLALDAFPDRAFHGRIRRVFPSGDPTTRLVPVEVALTGEDARLARPGFLARATFALGARADVLLIPGSALVGGVGSESVFVVEDGTAVRRTVTTGLTSEGKVQVVAGLEAGDLVVTRGANMLRDGVKVRVVSDEAGRAET